MAKYSNYVLPDLPWYERDGLMTWYNQAKSQEFLRNSKEHFNKTKIINFDIIHRLARGEKIPDDVLKKYETVQDSRISQYPKIPRNNFLSEAFKTERKDIYFEKKVINDYFKNK